MNYSSPLEKIKTIDELAKIVASLKSKGKKIVHCHGTFDLLHPGHYRYFEAAKKAGDVLIVTVTADEFVRKGPGRPIYTDALRAEFIAALGCVDYVAIDPNLTAVQAIHKLKPDIYAKGIEYAKHSNDISGAISLEEKTVKAAGGRMHYTNEITFSSSSLLNTHFDIYSPDLKKILERLRRLYRGEEVIAQMRRLKDLRVLVVGDAVIDRYIYSVALGRPSKAMVLAVKSEGSEDFAGGALAAANHIAGFCNEVALVTCLGKEVAYDEFIRAHLKENIRPFFFYRSDAPTTLKKRYVTQAYLQKLFEEYIFTEQPISQELTQKIGAKLKGLLPRYDVVLALDYGHGFLNQTLINILLSKAKFLAVNAQTNSANTGFNLITKYKGADYACLDDIEIRLALKDKYAGAETLIAKLATTMRTKKIIVTLGHQGSLASFNGKIFRCPAFSERPIDAVGAGDAYIAITTPCVAAGFPMDLVSIIGNAAGAIAIKIVGNRSSVEPVDLFKSLTTILK